MWLYKSLNFELRMHVVKYDPMYLCREIYIHELLKKNIVWLTISSYTLAMGKVSRCFSEKFHFLGFLRTTNSQEISMQQVQIQTLVKAPEDKNGNKSNVYIYIYKEKLRIKYEFSFTLVIISLQIAMRATSTSIG